MTIAEAIYERLNSDGAINARVSSRIYRGTRPQSALLPCMLLNRVDMIPQQGSAGRTHTERTRFQLDIWAEYPDDADSIADLVKQRLDGWTNTSEPAISSCFLDSENCNLEDEGEGDLLPEARVQQDWIIWSYAS